MGATSYLGPIHAIANATDHHRMSKYYDLFQIIALVVMVYSIVWAVLLLGHLVVHSVQTFVSGLKHIPVPAKRRR